MPQYARAAFDFNPGQEGDLGFSEDDVLMILEKDESGWWVGEHCVDGKVGEFPFNYVEVISEGEARSLMAAKERVGHRPAPTPPTSANTVKATNIKVVESELKSKTLTFKLEVALSAGGIKKIKRTMGQMRLLDSEVRKVVGSMERGLPPMWADMVKLGALDKAKREKMVEVYLEKYRGGADGVLDVLLVAWLGELPSKAPVDGSLNACVAVLRKIGNDARAGEPKGLPRVPQLALVEFTWTPQDKVELFMQEGQLIEVVTQDTGSVGWWQGRTVDGAGGLFPYNHVDLLEENVCKAVVAGTEVSKAQQAAHNMPTSTVSRMSKRISLGLFNSSSGGSGKSNAKAAKPKLAAKPRKKKFEQNFKLVSCESFDRLIDNGFTMESDGQIMSMTPPKEGPKAGDFVQLTYCAYVWDCQKQVIVEFAASDNPSKIAPEAGPLEFFVGKTGETIKGIDYAVQRMKTGQSCRVIITPQFAYGAVGAPKFDIPPNAHLVYDLKLDQFGRDESAQAETAPAPAPQSSKKPSRPSAAKPAAPMAAASKPPAPGGGGSLAEAIALRRAKVDAGMAGPAPVAERAPRANRLTKRMTTGAADKPELRGPAVPKESDKPKVEKMYTLKELQDIVRDKKVEAKGLESSSIEDALTDEEFEKAFKMSRTDFLLKPRWRQQALKRGVRLF